MNNAYTDWVREQQESRPVNGVQACENCRYWRRGRTDQMAGECRRQPPVATTNGDWPGRVFPSLFTEDWCGEWYAATGFTEQNLVAPELTKARHEARDP